MTTLQVRQRSHRKSSCQYQLLKGGWHRLLTSFELVVLQGLPAVLTAERPEGLSVTPQVLAGNSDKLWRERISNGIPVGNSEAWAQNIGKGTILSALGMVCSRSLESCGDSTRPLPWPSTLPSSAAAYPSLNFPDLRGC